MNLNWAVIGAHLLTLGIDGDEVMRTSSGTHE